MTVRGDTRVIVHEQRPVPLWQHVLVGSRLFDLFRTPRRQARRPRDRRTSILSCGNICPIGCALRRSARGDASVDAAAGWRPPHRPDVIARFDREGLLPLITFIFSRVGCDAAVRQCVQAGLWLTDPAERDEITALVEERTAGDSVGRSRGTRILGMARRAAPRGGRAPCRLDTSVQGDRRRAVRPRSGPRCVRHRDARSGHQHASPQCRARAADEVQR